MIEVKRRVTLMESSLENLDQQEGKNTTELNNVLKEYAELKEQAAEFDAAELMHERLALRPGKEHSALCCLQSVYGGKFQPLMMQNSKRDVSAMLGEKTQAQSIRERLHQNSQDSQRDIDTMLKEEQNNSTMRTIVRNKRAEKTYITTKKQNSMSTKQMSAHENR